MEIQSFSVTNDVNYILTSYNVSSFLYSRELMSKEVIVKLQVGYLGDEKEKYHFQSSEL